MGHMTPSMRGKLLGKLADLLAENSEAIGRIETKDTGKMFKETRWQCQYIAEYLRYYAGADKLWRYHANRQARYVCLY